MKIELELDVIEEVVLHGAFYSRKAQLMELIKNEAGIATASIVKMFEKELKQLEKLERKFNL